MTQEKARWLMGLEKGDRMVAACFVVIAALCSVIIYQQVEKRQSEKKSATEYKELGDRYIQSIQDQSKQYQLGARDQAEWDKQQFLQKDSANAAQLFEAIKRSKALNKMLKDKNE